MAKRIYAEKEGYISINDLRDYIYGLKNYEHSKVFFKVNERDGHYYLDTYVENTYPSDDERSVHNGFFHTLQHEMNEIGK